MPSFLALRKTMLIAVALTGCSDVSSTRAPVVYETDDRVEVYEQPAGVHRTIAETSIAMQMSEDWLDFTDPADVQITYDQTLSEAHTLCAGVAYEDQIEPGTCSGTLIDDRHILTAGHCVSAAEDCDGSTWPWVFGFYYEAADTLHTLTEDDVYYCVGTPALLDDATGDYAVIELDRPVVGHEPAVLGAADLGTPVTLIGHPNGIPMKIAGNATVRGIDGLELYADVDAFYGNSGSGVFDDAGEVIGILVAGAPDDYVDNGGCNVIEVIDPVPDGEGETLTEVGAVIDVFCATGVVSPVCGALPPDAGPPDVDAGGLPDAGSVDAGTATEDGGCGCRASSQSDGALGFLTILALVVLRGAMRRRSERR